MRAPYGKCPHCKTPLESTYLEPREHERSILYSVRCPKCGWMGHHNVIKPGPWRDLNPTSTRYPMGMRCPECSEPVEFAQNRRRAVCGSCGVHVDVDGNTGARCEYCGSVHWSDQARSWCEMYEYFKSTAKNPEPYLEEGSKEKPPWGVNSYWNALRDLIMKRDGHTCQDCGLSERVRKRLISERIAEARKASDNPYPPIEFPPELRVHHIVPKSAGGTDHPHNLVTVCEPCHMERHRLIGDGFEPYADVRVAVLRDEVVGEERARLLAGDHEIVARAREFRAMDPDRKRLHRDIELGVQATLEVMD